MKSFLELVKERRSVRRYLPRPVEPEKIDLCLEAARLAPSACNCQPWHFIVVSDPKKKDELARAAFGGIYATNAFASRAPVLVAALIRKAGILPGITGKFQDKHYPLIDLGIACEHFVLQAAELGLGTCWLGWFNQKAVERLLPCPPGAQPAIMISLGYPDAPPRGETKRRGLEEISARHGAAAIP